MKTWLQVLCVVFLWGSIAGLLTYQSVREAEEGDVKKAVYFGMPAAVLDIGLLFTVFGICAGLIPKCFNKKKSYRDAGANDCVESSSSSFFQSNLHAQNNTSDNERTRLLEVV